MDHLVERMRRADPRGIVLVTRPDKDDVLEHARALGLLVVQGEPASVAASILLGLGAIDAGDEVLLGFPDTIWEPLDGFAKLLAVLDSDTDAVLGVFESREPERSDVVSLTDDGIVSAIEVKPRRPLVWGCAAARRAVFSDLAAYDEPGPLFDRVAQAGRVRGVRLPGQLIDVGTPAALRQAVGIYGGAA